MTLLAKAIDPQNVPFAHPAGQAARYAWREHVGTHPDEVLPRALAFHNTILASPGTVQPIYQLHHQIADDPAKFSFGGSVDKTVYQHPNGDRDMVKPLSEGRGSWDRLEEGHPATGFAETATQALYHAGKIGHLIQGSHIAVHQDEQGEHPLLVIHMLRGTKPVSKATDEEEAAWMKDQDFARSVGQIHLMDYLTDQFDRNSDNLHVRQDEQGRAIPYAIDHGLALYPNTADPTQPWYDDASSATHGMLRDHGHVTEGQRFHPDALRWWDEHGPAIREEFRWHLPLILDEDARDALEQGFEHRARSLDEAATEQRQRDQAVAQVRQEALGKALHEDDVPFIRQDDPASPEKVPVYNWREHLKEHLKPALASIIGPRFAQFNKQVLHSREVVRPHLNKDDAGGTVEKLVYRHPDGIKSMVKPASNANSRIAGFAEVAMQSLYHAGGIGRLHQKVHLAGAPVGDQEHPMVVVHMEPGDTLGDVMKDIHSPDFGRWHANPENLFDLERVNLMDFVTDNEDRHVDNLMLRKQKGARHTWPLMAIDHGYAFRFRRGPVWSQHTRSATQQVLPKEANGVDGISPRALAWWKEAAPKIREEFLKHVALIDHKRTRERVRDEVLARMDWLSSLDPADPQLNDKVRARHKQAHDAHYGAMDAAARAGLW